MSEKFNENCERPDDWTNCLSGYCDEESCAIWSRIADLAYQECLETEHE